MSPLSSHLKDNFILLLSLSKCKKSLADSLLAICPLPLGLLIHQLAVFVKRNRSSLEGPNRKKLRPYAPILYKFCSVKSSKLLLRVIRKDGIRFFRPLVQIGDILLSGDESQINSRAGSPAISIASSASLSPDQFINPLGHKISEI